MESKEYKKDEGLIFMTVTTNILDVLPDGTIACASFAVSSIICVKISRLNLHKPFTITSCDVLSEDEHQLSGAVEAIRSTMLEHDIDIMIPVASPKLSKN